MQNDTIHFRDALEAYRVRSGDQRQVSELPLSILSGILLEAQRMKDSNSPESDTEYARR